MRLKRLEIYGFKSFADRTVVEFDQGITGIVGPNGSGKSNLSDAVRWVLGEQSAKSLRGGKMEDIIFGGTEHRRRMGLCEVSLVFDNEDHQLPLDFSEVMITRRAYRAGEGEYLINRTPCRLKDIIDLFRDTGVGKEGYSIIGQGRIDEILSQKSEDRRAIFEEAAGIVKYRARKEESEKRLQNMRENLVRVADVIAELEKQVEPLRQASENARRYLSLRDQMRSLECTVYVVRADAYEARSRKDGEALSDMMHQAEQMEASIAQLALSRDQMADRVGDLDLKVNEAHGRVLSLTREREAMQGSMKVLSLEIAQLERDVLSLTQEVDVRTLQMKQLQEQLQDNKSGMTQETAQHACLCAQLEEAQAKLHTESDALLAAERMLDAHKEALIEAMNRRSNDMTAEARLSTLRQELDRRRQEADEELSRRDEELSALEESLNSAKAELSAISEEVGHRETAIHESQERQQELSLLQQKLREQGDSLNVECSALRSRLHVLQEMERDYSGYAQSVKRVLQQFSRRPGVHGVVASLISVPETLEKAVESVLGGALQHIVTEDEYVARDMIEWLRKEKAGRATFLPVSTIRGRTLTPQEREVLSMPGCIGLASELVSFDPRFRGIIENLLGRTVVAENLDAGIAIMRRGRQAFRLVTLEGDVMHSGGSMTGGSVQSRMTSLLSREREIKEHIERIAMTEGQLSDLSSRAQQLASQMQDLRKEREGQFALLNQVRIDASIVEERIRQLEQHGKELSQARENTLELLRQIEANAREVSSQLNHVTVSREDEEHSQEEMNARTEVLQGQVQHLRLSVEQLRSGAEALRLEVSGCAHRIESLRREAERLEGEHRKCAIDIGDAQEKIGSKTLEHQNRLQELAGTRELFDRRESELEEENSRLATLQGEREDAQRQVIRLGNDMDTQRRSQQDLQDRIHRLSSQLEKMKSEVDALSSRIWDEYELTYALARAHLDESIDVKDAEKQVARLRSEIRSLGPVNVAAIEEYRTCQERYDTLTSQRDDLLKAERDLLGIIDSLKRQMETQFLQSFTLLQQYLSETFQRLFGGGTAKLQLQDEKEALTCGIDIVAQPPGKKLQMLSLLSGGERALTAIAILFAMLRLKPTPFCFLDEIEAALDDGNISTFAEYLKNFSKNTQFVIVTHRKGTMERCDCLYGVAMEEKGVTRILSVQLKDVDERAVQ